MIKIVSFINFIILIYVMTEAIRRYTTIRISKDLKKKLDSVTSKNESYDEVLEKLIEESHSIKTVERSFLREMERKRYVKFEDIQW